MATRCCVSRVVGQPPLCPADPAPQSEPLDERQVPNSAGGHVYPVDDMTRLRRFLILGSEGGSYYANERKLTLENAAAVKRCIENDGPRAVYEIAYISRHGRAPKVGPPLFALAMTASYGHLGTRALAFGYLSQMVRTGSQLQMFIDYIGTMRGWGRSLRRAVGKWYTEKDIQQAVYQAVKYRQRYNWTHRDLLRKAHPKAGSSEVNDLFAWITKGTMPDEDNDYFSLIHAYEEAKTANVDRLVTLITKYDMTWEMVPSEQLDKPEVWEALAVRMPLTALVRNLATLTRLGVIAPMKSTWVCERLNAIGNPLTEDFARIHPIAVLSALLTYRSGKGARGSNTWTPLPLRYVRRAGPHAPDGGRRHGHGHRPQGAQLLHRGICQWRRWLPAWLHEGRSHHGPTVHHGGR